MKPSIGEQAITPQVQQQVTPDVVSPDGQQQLLQRSAQATAIKQQFDAIMQAVADKVGGEFSSRVKDTDTAMKKIAQKRIEGRGDYGIDDINDMLGYRLIVDSEKDIPKAKKAVEGLADKKIFTINKAEDASHGNYHAFHFDVTLGGLPVEIQVTSSKNEAEAVVNHDLRAVYSEKPPAIVAKLQNAQAQEVQELSPEKARILSKTIQALRKNTPSKMLHPAITAILVQNAKK